MNEKKVTMNFPINLYNKILKISFENKAYNNVNIPKGKKRKPDTITELIISACEGIYGNK